MRRILLVAIVAMVSSGQAHAQISCGNFTLGANQQIAACSALINRFTDAGSSRIRITAADRARFNIFLNRGTAFARNGDVERSMADFRRAIEMTNEALEEGGKPLPSEYQDRCWARAVANIELDLALTDCNEAVRATPQSAPVLDTRAFVYLRMGRNEDAIRDYDTALQGNTKLSASFYGRGVAKLRLGDVEGAKADLFMAEMLLPGTRARFTALGFAD